MRAAMLVPAMALALAACGGGTPSSQLPVGSNGSVFITTINGNTADVTRRAIASDGSLGDAQRVVTGTVSDTNYLTALDGLGDLSLTGEFTYFWTTAATLRRGEQVLAQVPAEGWCGGEGLTYGVCVLLDAERAAHTTELGFESPTETGSVIVVSLTDGAPIGEFGPYRGLSAVLGTGSPDELLLVSGGSIDEVVPSTVSRLDLRDGSTTTIGESVPGWREVCALSREGVLGVSTDYPQELSVVGSGTVGPLPLSEDDSPAGCSADGRFLYIERFQADAGQLVGISLETGEVVDTYELGTGRVLITR